MESKKDIWARWSVLVALLSLIAALIFNGIQVRGSAEAQRQAKVATELGLLAGIQTAMTESIYAKVPYSDELGELEAGKRTRISTAAYRAVAEEAYGMNYFAWLFNHDYLDAPEADELLGPVMVCEYEKTFTRVFAAPAGEVPELARFVQTHAPQIRCAR
jgi:hypothetical protein